MIDKHAIHLYCMQLLQEKIDDLHKLKKDIEHGLMNDSKSSAGDKHETSRAMAHLELEKLNVTENNFNSMLQNLSRLDATVNHPYPAPASLVKTDKGYFYISIPLGKISFSGITVYMISANAPFGEALCNLGDKKELNFNGMHYIVETIK